jgi:dipeptidyl aminopeptidase/acylaminoacyl peptidase
MTSNKTSARTEGRGDVSVQEVQFYSGGHRLAATLKLPADSATRGPVPAVVQGPGWLGLRDAKLYQPYHDALVGAGFAVLVFDYRGFGDSDGEARLLDPATQVEDIRNAVTYLETRDEVDAGRLGVFGSGGTGGGNAVMAAGLDGRIRAVVSQVPIADGRDWLRRMRRESEWLELLDRVERDRRQRVLTGSSELVDPRQEIMVATPERRTTTVKSDVDGRIPQQVELASADAVIAYRPLDVVGRIAPRALMLICVERDATTPEDHAILLFEQARPPKKLVVQTGTTHYAAYAQYADAVIPMIVDWFERHLAGGSVRPVAGELDDAIVYLHPR